MVDNYQMSKVQKKFMKQKWRKVVKIGGTGSGQKTDPRLTLLCLKGIYNVERKWYMVAR